MSAEEADVVRRDVTRSVEAEVHREERSWRSCSTDSDKENSRVAHPDLHVVRAPLSTVSKRGSLSTVICVIIVSLLLIMIPTIHNVHIITTTAAITAITFTTPTFTTIITTAAITLSQSLSPPLPSSVH